MNRTSNGFGKLSRKVSTLERHPVFEDDLCLAMFANFTNWAAWEDNELVKTGQLITSYQEINRYHKKHARAKIRRRVKNLADAGQIVIISNENCLIIELPHLSEWREESGKKRLAGDEWATSGRLAGEESATSGRLAGEQQTNNERSKSGTPQTGDFYNDNNNLQGCKNTKRTANEQQTNNERTANEQQANSERTASEQQTNNERSKSGTIIESRIKNQESRIKNQESINSPMNSHYHYDPAVGGGSIMVNDQEINSGKIIVNDQGKGGENEEFVIDKNIFLGQGFEELSKITDITDARRTMITEMIVAKKITLPEFNQIVREFSAKARLGGLVSAWGYFKAILKNHQKTQIEPSKEQIENEHYLFIEDPTFWAFDSEFIDENGWKCRTWRKKTYRFFDLTGHENTKGWLNPKEMENFKNHVTEKYGAEVYDKCKNL